MRTAGGPCHLYIGFETGFYLQQLKKKSKSLCPNGGGTNMSTSCEGLLTEAASLIKEVLSRTLAPATVLQLKVVDEIRSD